MKEWKLILDGISMTADKKTKWGKGLTFSYRTLALILLLLLYFGFREYRSQNSGMKYDISEIKKTMIEVRLQFQAAAVYKVENTKEHEAFKRDIGKMTNDVSFIKGRLGIYKTLNHE